MPLAITPLIPRDYFDLPAEGIWVSHCKDGPLPRVSAQAVARILQTELEPWALRWQEDFLDIQARLRESAAAFFGESSSDMSLVTCTSTGLEAVAFGFPWTDGDEVVIPHGEFPSNRLPWLALARRGVRCIEVPLWGGHDGDVAVPPHAGIDPEQRLLDAITPRTRLMSVSWVRYQDGTRLDLDRLGRGCRERGVHLVVDGIQGAGTVPPSLDHVSAFSTGGHKGLLGTQGQGLLWTDRAFRQQLLPLGTWLSMSQQFSQAGTASPSTGDHWAEDGRYLEAGSPSILACVALAESIRLLLSVGGAAAIEAHVARLQRRLLEGLAALPFWHGEAHRLLALLEARRIGSILSFQIGEEAAGEAIRQGERQGIHASYRERYLRFALHGWHSSEDVDRCVEWLKASVGG